MMSAAGFTESRIDAVRNVMLREKFTKIDDAYMDFHSARIIIDYYDSLMNEDAKRRFERLMASRMATVAYKMTK